jgi:multidrug efflux pump subunit AcrA (membrane-fusion protein)
VIIAPQQTGIAARGREIPLRAGLSVTAEIITERKSVLSLLLEPFRKLKGEI